MTTPTPSPASLQTDTPTPERSETTFRFLAEPTSVNFGGKVHGGALMKWIDETGYACAAMWSGRYCVTVSVGNIRFRRPILVGKDTKMPDWVVLISTLGGMALFGINGFVIGPLVAALFMASWDLFSQDEASKR